MDRAELARLLGASPVAAEKHNVIIDERDPARFIEVFASAVAARGTVFVGDPSWSRNEREQFNALVARIPAMEDGAQSSGWLCLPTGGSSGAIKLARHDEGTIVAAVNGFCAHFGVQRVNVIGLLPLSHVSGMMAWMRTALTGGEYRPWAWKALEAGNRPVLPVNAGDWFISLVPTQLQRLLAVPDSVEWLRGFRAVFVGGGPAWPDLVEKGARAGLPLAFTYGMTETAAMIAALRPSEFLAGGRGCGTSLSHGQITLDGEGRVVVSGESLFRGYWPALRETGPWTTGDLGHRDDRGFLHLLGRSDAIIISGGKKIEPGEVEAALRATGEFADVAVIGVPDREWGEIVVGCYLASRQGPDLFRVSRELGRLAPYKHPKRYVSVVAWPRNAQGKVSRAELLRRIGLA